MTEAARSHAAAASPPPRHGLAITTDGGAVHFGIAVWPYDVLLRFGYDLPENEHLWPGEWFDDRFERAALDLRSNAAKLIIAIRGMHKAAGSLQAAVAADSPTHDLRALKDGAEGTPLAVDLVLSYVRLLLRDLAAVIPCCYGIDGRALIDDRSNVGGLAASPELARLDPALATLLQGVPAFDVRTSKDDLYVIAESDGFSSALPKAAARLLRAAAAVTMSAMADIDAAVAALCAWFDAVLAHLQQVVADRSEPGPELLERWADPNWSVLLSLRAADPALGAHLPRIAVG